MSRRHLTSKQHAFLEYLQEHLQEQKVWPTYREIVDHFEYRSPNSVTQNLQALTRKGFLRRDRDGYHLVQRDGKDGSIPVRWTLTTGQVEPPEATERISLASLFQDVSGVGALKLSDAIARTAELGDAHYVFMSEGDVSEGDVAVILTDGALTLQTVGPEGLAQSDSTTVLGRYAGHAGPYGLVRRAATPVSAPTSEG